MKNAVLFAALFLAGCNSEQQAVEPKPFVVLLATDAASSMRPGDVMGPVPQELTAAGFELMSLDLPCHGSDGDGSSPLMCWRQRIEAGDTQIFARFCAQLSAAITSRGAQQVAVVGQSRGAYAAVQCAALDARITRAALLIPVTDLARLTEFNGFTVPAEFDLPTISIPTYIRIGFNDERVGTDAAVSYGQRIGSTIDVINVPGHDPAEDGSTVRWLLQHP